MALFELMQKIIMSYSDERPSEENDKVSKSKSNSSKNNSDLSQLTCMCGKKFVRLNWYTKHTSNCSVHIRKTNDKFAIEPTIPAHIIILNNLIEQEGVEDIGENEDEEKEESLRTDEIRMENEENAFDASFSSHLMIDDIE